MYTNTFTKSVTSTIVISLFLSSLTPLAYAAEAQPSEGVPSPYCVGGSGEGGICATFGPSNPAGQMSPAPTSLYTTNAPTGGQVPPVQPTSDPCISERSSIQHWPGKKKKWKHKKKRRGGGASNMLERLIELIKQLFEKLGIPLPEGLNSPTIPDNNNDQQPDGNNDQQPDDNNNPQNPCITPGDDGSNNDDGNNGGNNEQPTSNPEPTNAVPQPSTQSPTGGTGTTPANPAPTNIVNQPTGGGTVAGCAQADIQNLVNSVSEANIKANLQKLIQDDAKTLPNELGSRFVGNPGNAAKVQWVQQQFTSYGLSAQLQPFSGSGRNLNNVIGSINGSNANSFYAVGGHIDSINDDDESGPAPGADDDGSAIAVAMEVARVLKGLPQQCFKSGVQFVGFNDEENSMGGSETYVKALSGKTFKGLFNMDMVGAKGSSDCVQNLYNSSKDQFMATKITEVNTKYNVGLTLEDGTYSSSDIDSISFWSAGQPSSYQVECADSPGYHTADDTTQHISYTQMTKLAKVLVAAVAELVNQ